MSDGQESPRRFSDNKFLAYTSSGRPWVVRLVKIRKFTDRRYRNRDSQWIPIHGVQVLAQSLDRPDDVEAILVRRLLPYDQAAVAATNDDLQRVQEINEEIQRLTQTLEQEKREIKSRIERRYFRYCNGDFGGLTDAEVLTIAQEDPAIELLPLRDYVKNPYRDDLDDEFDPDREHGEDTPDENDDIEDPAAEDF